MPERSSWDHAGKSTTERGYGWQHQKIRAALMREVVLCEECKRNGRTELGTVADHKVALAKGGSRDRSNYQLLCKECAEAKDARDRGVSLKPKHRIGNDGWPA